MKKQTAVEWLLNELRTKMGYGNNLGKTAQIIFDVITYEAKAMEKEQIVNAFKEGLRSPYHQDYTIVTQEGQEGTKSGQYYNETYGGDK